MGQINKTLYLLMKQSMHTDKDEILIGDAARIKCSDTNLAEKIKKLPVVNLKEEKRKILSILDVISCIENHYPDIKIENLGCTDLIIVKEKEKEKGSFIQILKMLFVLGITFTGASFSMIAFNNDINSSRLFEHIQYLFTGEISKGFTFLEFSYCIGLTAGILLFFDHLKKSTKSKDPTPMEIEMRLYEKDIQTTIIENNERKKKNNVG